MEPTANPGGASVTVPRDLADILVEAELVVRRPVDMSALSGILDTAVSVASAVITLAQGPVTAAELIGYLRTWIDKRRQRENNTHELILRDNRISIKMRVDHLTDYQRLSQALADLLNAAHSKPPVRRSTSFDDDS